MLDFRVVSHSTIVTGPDESALHRVSRIVLQQDRWNDFWFYTLYHLHVFTKEFEGRIGAVKILRRGQKQNDPIQLRVGPLEQLSTEYCALGQSLDYYERLAELPSELQKDILVHIRDVLILPEHAKTFFNEHGWRISMLRDIDWHPFQRDASAMLNRDYTQMAELEQDMIFHAKGWAKPLHLRFSVPKDRWSRDQSRVAKLPERIAVITGRNGSGKSTLLARLARVLHASQSDRASDKLGEFGNIEPSRIGFSRVLNIAYSAFDAFQIPGFDEKERRQIAHDLKRGVGRYHYCGLRDIVRELEEGADAGEDVQQTTANPGPNDHQRRTVLKSTDDLAAEFVRMIEKIQKDGRADLLDDAIEILANDPSFQDLEVDPVSSVSSKPQGLFWRWSTGHKIVMHAMMSIVAYTEPRSIVLIDEPESHLHPPLLAAFMHALRLILEEKKALAVVATHSPVVVQETLGRHVSVVRRSGTETTIYPPRIETYGESIGTITDEIFGLNSDATDFHKTLHHLVQSGMTLERIEGLFKDGLSLQGRAYVMSELARKD